VNVFKLIDRIISAMESLFLGLGIIGCSAILFADVVLRYVFLMPLSWSEELVRYVMVWMVFVGSSVIVKKGGHVAVDVLPLFLPPKLKKALERLIPISAIVFCLVLFYFSWHHTMRVKLSNQITTAMEAPMWVMYLAIPVGSLMMAIRWAQLVVAQWFIKEEKFIEETEPMD
jgi:C4-dicarboxylate transporter DctQ subunit